LQKDGRTVEINREFGDDIENLHSTSSSSSTPADLSALEAQVNALQVLVNALVLSNTDLEERVHVLETGYQS
jgi:hypothetical protein